MLAGTVTRRAFWGGCGVSCRGAIESATQRISRAWQNSSWIMFEVRAKPPASERPFMTAKYFVTASCVAVAHQVESK